MDKLLVGVEEKAGYYLNYKNIEKRLKGIKNFYVVQHTPPR